LDLPWVQARLSWSRSRPARRAASGRWRYGCRASGARGLLADVARLDTPEEQVVNDIDHFGGVCHGVTHFAGGSNRMVEPKQTPFLSERPLRTPPLTVFSLPRLPFPFHNRPTLAPAGFACVDCRRFPVQLGADKWALCDDCRARREAAAREKAIRSMPPLPRRCDACGEAFAPKRHNNRAYCSSRCRLRAWRAAQRAAAV
jgi:hypothetical protein